MIGITQASFRMNLLQAFPTLAVLEAAQYGVRALVNEGDLSKASSLAQGLLTQLQRKGESSLAMGGSRIVRMFDPLFGRRRSGWR